MPDTLTPPISHLEAIPTTTPGVGTFWRLAGGFWHGETRPLAVTLTSVSVVLVLLNIGVQYGITVGTHSSSIRSTSTAPRRSPARSACS